MVMGRKEADTVTILFGLSKFIQPRILMTMYISQ